MIDCPFPAQFDAAAKRWRFEAGPITWEEVLVRWKGRGPANEEYVRQIQRGYKQLYEPSAVSRQRSGDEAQPRRSVS